jgi:hypothetical protein
MRLVKHAKNKPKAHPQASNKTTMPPAEDRIGKVSRERAIEMLEHEKKHIWT